VVENAVEFLDAGGAPRLRMANPFVVDRAGAYQKANVVVRGCAYDADPRAPWGRAVTLPNSAACVVTVAWDAAIAYPAVLDPVWTTTGSMAMARELHAAAVLASGRVLVVGGTQLGVSISTAELYDPSSGTFAATGSMATGRLLPTASL